MCHKQIIIEIGEPPRKRNTTSGQKERKERNTARERESQRERQSQRQGERARE